MNIRLLHLATASVSILSLTMVTNAQETQQASATGAPSLQPPPFQSKKLPPAPDSPLEKQMKILARGTKQLSQQLSNSSKQQENIALLETLKKAASDAKELNPRKATQIPQSDLEKFLADYRAQIDKLSDAFNQIEEAVKAGNYDRAVTLMSTVGPLKKEGHKNFKVD